MGSFALKGQEEYSLRIYPQEQIQRQMRPLAGDESPACIPPPFQGGKRAAKRQRNRARRLNAWKKSIPRSPVLKGQRNIGWGFNPSFDCRIRPAHLFVKFLKSRAGAAVE